jgi:hypothetical protein
MYMSVAICEISQSAGDLRTDLFKALRRLTGDRQSAKHSLAQTIHKLTKRYPRFNIIFNF